MPKRPKKKLARKPQSPEGKGAQRANIKANALATSPNAAANSFPSHQTAQTCSRTESRNTKPEGTSDTQKGGSLSKKNPPQTSLRESFFLGVMIAIFAGLFLLVVQKYNENSTLQVSLDNTKASLENEQRRSRQLDADVKAIKKQNKIFDILGPHVAAFQRLTVGREGETSTIHLGRCPNRPCFMLTYEGLEKKQEESYLKWGVEGENRGPARFQLKNISLDVPAQELCYGIIYARGDSTIKVVLENIPSPDSFEVVAALIHPPFPSPRSSYFPPFEFDCVKE